MIFEVCVAEEFSAAHWLNDYDGNCANIHGHNWTVEVLLSGIELNSSGMLVDFRDIKKLLAAQLQKFDHRLLNEISPFDSINPTAENIARYLYEQLYDAFPGCSLERVKVWESHKAWASFGKGNDLI